MKTTRISVILLAFVMAIGMFSGCTKEEDKKNMAADSENVPGEKVSEPKGPTDEELIDEALNAASEAICDFDMEKASEYILDESEFEKCILATPEVIDEGIEEINQKAGEEIENNYLLKYVSDNIKKTIKQTVSDGLQKGKQEIIDSVEFEWGDKEIDGDKAVVDVTVKVGGKKILVVMNSGKDDDAINMVMEYLEKVLDEKGKTALLVDAEGVAKAVVDKITDDIKNGEKEEMTFTASLEKIDGQWLITEMKEAEIV